MKKRHKIQSVSFSGNEMTLKVDGKVHTWSLKRISARLAKARDFEREKFDLSPSGYGIHWPLIDEDLSIDGLLKTPQVKKPRSIAS